VFNVIVTLYIVILQTGTQFADVLIPTRRWSKKKSVPLFSEHQSASVKRNLSLKGVFVLAHCRNWFEKNLLRTKIFSVIFVDLPFLFVIVVKLKIQFVRRI
jgi:hypothetical protein